MSRHLEIVEPQQGSSAMLLLMESDGTPVKSYVSSDGWFVTLDHGGRKWRLNGRDRETGEIIYLPEVVSDQD